MKEQKDIVYKNPFPVTAVANFYNNMQNNMIVETNAIKQMKEIVDKWILEGNDGITIAVQGEYGTGKTQLAIEIQKYVQKCDDQRYHFICLESPAASFLEMYKNRFLNEITKELVLDRLEECYSQIILDDLKQNEIYKKVIQYNSKARSIELIERFGLAKSTYDAEFEKQLEKVTQNIKFVPALLLLLESRFDKEVWEWFKGTEPTEAMKERGIKFSINDDAIALEAISVFAFLFGRQGHTFILFIDEMEKILSSTDRIKEKTFDALKKFIETVKATKSMLILCGLPDYYIALPSDTKQRIAHQIRTREISISEIEKYICKANEKVNGITSYIPFDKEILQQILDISNGNIRTIIRLLYHSANWYIEKKSKIDEKALCEILTNAYGTANVKGTKRKLIQIFLSKGWLYKEIKVAENSENTEADFLLPSVFVKKGATDNKSIKIYLVGNVLSEIDYNRIYQRIGNTTNGCKICIVDGFISEKLYKQLVEIKNTHILRFRIPDFSQLFVSIIEGEKIRQENTLKQNDYFIINEKVDQLIRIVNNAINDFDRNMISKQEFYYYVQRYLNTNQNDFYSKPDKESEFYLLISEIERVIQLFDGKRLENYERGALYLFKEFSYILYYIVEQPEKVNIFTYKNVFQAFNNLNGIVKCFLRNCGSLFHDMLEKYIFILEYLSANSVNKTIRIQRYKYKDDRLMYIANDDGFFAISNGLKQISQDFCAQLLIDNPEIVERYNQLFASVYYFLNVLDPTPAKWEHVLLNLEPEILREYYDLMTEYFEGFGDPTYKEYADTVFSNYDRILGRVLIEKRY